MFDFEDVPDLDQAFDAVLANASFSAYSRESLSSCETFCDMLRQAQHEDIVALSSELAEIALETDDHNEAGGFLMMVVNLGGGVKSVESPKKGNADVPIDNLDDFIDWVIAVPAGEREDAYQRVLDAQVKARLRVKDDDVEAHLRLHQIATVRDYVLNSVKMIKEFGNYATDHLSSDFPIQEQIPDRLWEAFSSRGEKETAIIIEKWWGSKAQMPQDFFIALEWQRLGYITIHKGKHYAESVAEYLLFSCEPLEGETENSKIALQAERSAQLYPHLKQDLAEALERKEGYRWIVNHDMAMRTRYIKQLINAGIIERQQFLSVLDMGISKRWNSQFLQAYTELREAL